MKYYIIAGEKSGDLHGSNLIKAIQEEDSDANIRGIGGELMVKNGLDQFLHFHKVNFFGFYEVFINLITIFKIFKQTEKDILQFKPDVIILIDFAGFNLRMAKFAKKHGVKVFYYISPKVWAWNTGRANKIKKLVDRMFVILPFEVPFYKQFDYEVDYVGNPIMDSITSFSINPDFKTSEKIGEKPIIALLPGSRPAEVSSLLEMLVSIKDSFEQYQFVVAAVSSLPSSYYEHAKNAGVKIVFDQTYDLLSVAEAAIVASGTATLETGLFNVPQVVVYKVSTVSYEIAKRLVKVRDIALVNLITDKIIVKTLLQKDLTVSNLGLELKNVLIGGSERDRILFEYVKLRKEIGEPGASLKAGSLMVKYLQK